ncbi:MAG: GxxExxY protein [Candidatus Magasanikbacteria bacterium RIFCSPHIGHO2_02_FULL_51_14]|uniref:GxxExxY protein n=1 Tax=Candidatus Magasanikbacteria bacterium RIFCSPHIGHO2_02_FULL_51_14 TaxID=1798683 RepID=A0A1F6MQD7_9BACT|nr:MAG: GxxExxY protein [Candidatus Magasanikbacteria bacterium RIFCSPHIGHO2_02_FULL_51_14]
MSAELKHKDLSERIIKAYYYVYNRLGYGFLENVYEKSMVIALPMFGVHGRRQVPIRVYFEEQNVGLYFADIVAEELIILELKAAESLCVEHEVQLTNYLRATDIEVGFLFNFGAKPEFRRKVFENKYKEHVREKDPFVSVQSVQSANPSK